MVHPKIILKSGRDERICLGYLWAFSNEIESAESSISPGAIVDIYSHRKKFMGRGFYNPHSLIAARILTFDDIPINFAFFSARIENAQRKRALLYPSESSYRLVFGESDQLPGLIIDRYENCFVVRSYCLGMDLLMPAVLEGLRRNFKSDCIVKRSDSPIRKLEQLEDQVEIVSGQLDSPVTVPQKCGVQTIRFWADLVRGQKTGFYFDQRENRERLTDYCAGKSVLDCFSYTGGFALYAAKWGASEVVSVDSSAEAGKIMMENLNLNSAQAAIIQGDVFEALEQFQKQNRKFDIIVLDPPALVKSKKNLFSGLRRYKKLNELALATLSRDGVLFSSSCSHHVGRKDFLAMINESALAVGRQVQVLELRGASRDHPVLPAMPETEYMKCAVLRVV